MRLKIYFYISLLAFGVSVYANAETNIIELKNGDRINGVLIEVSDKTVVWKSDILGELYFPLDQVVNVASYITEQENKKPIKPEWRNIGNFLISGRKEDKDLKKEEWDILVETEYQKEDERHKLKVSYESDVNNSTHTEEEYYTGYDYSWFFRPQWFVNYSLAWERNEAKNIKEQYVTGVGLGYQFWSTKIHHLEVEAGVNYIDKHFFIPTSQNDEYIAGRWHLDWWFKPTPTLRLFHQHEFLQSFSGSDYELDTESGARLLFSSALYGELKYEWNYDSASTTDKNQSTWVLGLGYDW